MYDRGGKALEGMFKNYMNALPDGDDILGEPTLKDIVKLPTMNGESKSGLSTYYIKLRHVKTVFDAMLDRIGEMEINDSTSTDIIFLTKH